jgi:hypothetical protein
MNDYKNKRINYYKPRSVSVTSYDTGVTVLAYLVGNISLINSHGTGAMPTFMEKYSEQKSSSGMTGREYQLVAYVYAPSSRQHNAQLVMETNDRALLPTTCTRQMHVTVPANWDAADTT